MNNLEKQIHSRTKKMMKLIITETKDQTHKQSMRFFCLLLYRKPTLSEVCWASRAPVTHTRFAVGFTRWHSADRKLQVANRRSISNSYQTQVWYLKISDLGEAKVWYLVVNEWLKVHYIIESKVHGSHFGLPPSSIHRMTGWVANSRILWHMRTAPIEVYFRLFTSVGWPSKKKIETSVKSESVLVHWDCLTTVHCYRSSVLSATIAMVIACFVPAGRKNCAKANFVGFCSVLQNLRYRTPLRLQYANEWVREKCCYKLVRESISRFVYDHDDREKEKKKWERTEQSREMSQPRGLPGRPTLNQRHSLCLWL